MLFTALNNYNKEIAAEMLRVGLLVINANGLKKPNEEQQEKLLDTFACCIVLDAENPNEYTFEEFAEAAPALLALGLLNRDAGIRWSLRLTEKHNYKQDLFQLEVDTKSGEPVAAYDLTTGEKITYKIED